MVVRGGWPRVVTSPHYTTHRIGDSPHDAPTTLHHSLPPQHHHPTSPRPPITTSPQPPICTTPHHRNTTSPQRHTHASPHQRITATTYPHNTTGPDPATTRKRAAPPPCRPGTETGRSAPGPPRPVIVTVTARAASVPHTTSAFLCGGVGVVPVPFPIRPPARPRDGARACGPGGSAAGASGATGSAAATPRTPQRTGPARSATGPCPARSRQGAKRPARTGTGGREAPPARGRGGAETPGRPGRLDRREQHGAPAAQRTATERLGAPVRHEQTGGDETRSAGPRSGGIHGMRTKRDQVLGWRYRRGLGRRCVC